MVAATTDNGETALHVATINAHYAVLRVLLLFGAKTELNPRLGGRHCTSLGTISVQVLHGG